MRIGMFSDSYTPYISGVVRSIQTLRRGMEQAGHEVYVFGPRYPEGLGAPDASDEARVVRFPSVAAPLYPQFRIPVPRQAQVREAVARLGLDVLHTHTPFVMGRMALQAARVLGRPVCFTFHTRYDVYLRHYAPGAGAVLVPALNAYVRKFCNACDLVIAPTRAIARRVEELGVRSPVAVVPTGVAVGRFAGGDPGERLRVRLQLGLERDDPVLLYTGRLSREKNLPLLLESFRRLAAVEPSVRLVLVGDGPLRPTLERTVAAWGLSSRVRLTGAVPPDRIAAFYRAADVYVFPSVTETQGLVVVEAMAAGLPVVAVASEVSEEILADGRAGLVVPASPDDLARACRHLVDDPRLRREMGRAAQQAARRYDGDTILARILELYEALRAGSLRREAAARRA
ncbi:glycosyl transferase group 1 [Thermaerobacter marianensis DSM 12885]|uniref:Glycosyl transferase group 1 n=1 Tax=Thermaerobacter marianensis (strain ATCC 700841 / DSM 12885 / JCM 10246 / 7p75a) TaxID=644966 RepID=E6SL77_THEM7|nr:glycosyltransferase family 4 protein [Thermaerobacter marianensis]ADU51308.1 glycosyl transferase group 1 [Thermaerobacter marianensis DSM 12885]